MSAQSEIKLSRKELGDLFGISGSTIKRRSEDGTLRGTWANSRVVFYNLDDFHRLESLGYRMDPKKAFKLGLVTESSVSQFPGAPSRQIQSRAAVSDEAKSLIHLLEAHLHQHPEAAPYFMCELGRILMKGSRPEASARSA